MRKLLHEELNQMKYLFGYKRGEVISEQTAQPEIKQGAKGDPYQYKREGGKYFYAKKGTENWTEQTNPNGIKAIEDRIFGGAAKTGGFVTGTMQTPQGVYDYLATDPSKMNNAPFKTFGFFDHKDGLRVDGVASNLTKDELIAQSKSTGGQQDFSNYTFPDAPEGGFVPGYVGNFDRSTTTTPAPTPLPQVDPESQKKDTMTDEWCNANELLADEDCFTASNPDKETARKMAYDEAQKGARRYGPRAEFWDEQNKIYYTIYGSRSLSARELRKRKEMSTAQPETETPAPQQNIPAETPQGRDMKTPPDFDTEFYT